MKNQDLTAGLQTLPGEARTGVLKSSSAKIGSAGMIEDAEKRAAYFCRELEHDAVCLFVCRSYLYAGVGMVCARTGSSPG